MRRRIVIIEDDDTIIDLMHESLSEAGVAVEFQVFQTGTEGMRWAERVPLDRPVVDLVILDLNLPGYNGIEILARLRARGGTRFPVVVMSGSLQPRDRDRSLAGGATAFLAKPSDLDGYFANGRALRDLMRARDAGSEAAGW